MEQPAETAAWPGGPCWIRCQEGRTPGRTGLQGFGHGGGRLVRSLWTNCESKWHSKGILLQSNPKESLCLSEKWKIGSARGAHILASPYENSQTAPTRAPKFSTSLMSVISKRNILSFTAFKRLGIVIDTLDIGFFLVKISKCLCCSKKSLIILTLRLKPVQNQPLDLRMVKKVQNPNLELREW